MTYYKVKTARELIPNYADYIKNQIFESYIVDPNGPLAKQVAPNPIPPTRIKVRLPWKYDQPIGNNGAFIEQKFVNVDRDKVILDCACGGGAQMDQLKRMGFKYVVGAELSSKFLTTAKGAADGVLKADMHWLGFRNETFDYICSFHTVEHAYFASILLHEFFRTLKNDGRLFVILPYPDGGHENDFHVAKYELGTNILDQGKSVLKFFVANGFRPTIVEHSKGLANEPLLWLQFRKRLHIRGKPFTWNDNDKIFFSLKSTS